MNCYNDKKDDTLVELALLGNRDAYEELVIRHENAVRGTAYKVTGNRFSAEDASQDAFVSAWIKLDNLRDGKKFGAWVCAIAKNCARNIVIHYQNTIPDISLNLEDTSFVNEHEKNIDLHNAVDTLSEKIREAISLHYFQGLSVDEIAQKLSLPKGTVKWRLSEGRKQLRKEYGVMDNIYDEKKTLVQRVMQQVEQLKLWELKANKNGFEAEYRAVLSEVEKLEESNDKQHALADTLLRGYWWLPGEKNQETFARIKEAAEKSHNEDVMQSVICHEYNKYSGQEKIDYMLNIQIPYLEQNRFVKSLGYIWFWLGYAYYMEKQTDKGKEAYKKVLELLDSEDVYYANALAAIHIEEKKELLNLDDTSLLYTATASVLRIMDNKLYFWEQPGYGNMHIPDDPFVYAACDGLIFDAQAKPGDVIISSDGVSTLTYKSDNVKIITPLGEFENCSLWTFSGDKWNMDYVETAFCPGVGIVYQMIKGHNIKHQWKLSDYEIKGGSGLIPFAPGNYWNYTLVTESGADNKNVENKFEVVSFKNNRVILKHYCTQPIESYNKSWMGNMLYARNNYAIQKDNNSWSLVDVEKYLRDAAEVAVTKRQKVHTTIATDVMKRIFTTDPDYNPDYTEAGRWNFFCDYGIKKLNGNILSKVNHIYSFEWKNMSYCGDECYKLLYNDIYELLSGATGFLWSDQWVPEYHSDEDREYFLNNTHLTLDVLADETITTSAGTFENCRHISFNLKGLGPGLEYRGGKMNYWFAPGIGIVKFSALYKNDTLESVWELTEYKGMGEGYFPLGDDLFRRYEPVEIGNGCHAYVEYTFVEDEDGLIFFKYALGTQDRANYEADIAQK